MQSEVFITFCKQRMFHIKYTCAQMWSEAVEVNTNQLMPAIDSFNWQLIIQHFVNIIIDRKISFYEEVLVCLIFFRYQFNMTPTLSYSIALAAFCLTIIHLSQAQFPVVQPSNPSSDVSNGVGNEANNIVQGNRDNDNSRRRSDNNRRRGSDNREGRQLANVGELKEILRWKQIGYEGVEATDSE